MSLPLSTFSASRGGNVLYKALTHPLAWEGRDALAGSLSGSRALAVFDPDGRFPVVCAMMGLSPPAPVVRLVQRCEDLVAAPEPLPIAPLASLPDLDIDTLWLLVFDDRRLRAQLEPWLPADVGVESLAPLRLPDEWLTRPRHYLDPLNFATNQAFFRDQDGLHTRLTLCNYFSGYGARAPRLRALLFDGQGTEIARLDRDLGAAGENLVLDSRQLREALNLPAFTGQLFLHVTGAAGHDVVKYVLDLYGDGDAAISATHDANAWPAQRYGGLPAPVGEERVLLWLQNPHPFPIPEGELALSPPGRPPVHPIAGGLPAMATRAVDIGRLTGTGPDRQWVLHCGQALTRPRYEVIENTRRRMAHLNVHRGDLEPVADLSDAWPHLGKGHLLVAPVLDPAAFDTELLVTPMSTAQSAIGLTVTVRDPSGEAVDHRSLGLVTADRHRWQTIGTEAQRFSGGHLELAYERSDPGPVDGWFHAVFRYRDRRRQGQGHAAETSFGSHLFNGLMTYRDEPQSYAGPPPGLSTRLFLRMGPPGFRTWCQLIYPTSTRWLPRSSTSLRLHDRSGRLRAEHSHAIPLDGSWSFRVDEVFDPDLLEHLGEGAWVLIRDHGCRLFGYQGLFRGDGFSLDHLFGF